MGGLKNKELKPISAKLKLKLNMADLGKDGKRFLKEKGTGKLSFLLIINFIINPKITRNDKMNNKLGWSWAKLSQGRG